MKITSAKYWDVDGKHDHVIAIIDGVEWHVPFDLDNTFYAEIDRLVKAGKLKIEDAD